MNTAPSALVLVAHGSRDPRAVVVTRALVRAVVAARPGAVVRAAFLDHAGPRPGPVLRGLEAAGHQHPVVVPLLLTSAYHHRLDLPRAVREAGSRTAVRVTDVLGPTRGVGDPLLLRGLRRRLAEAADGAGAGAGVRSDHSPPAGGTPDLVDAVVVAAAGTRDDTARNSVEQVAAGLGDLLGVPCRAAFGTGPGPTVEVAVSALRAAGARRVGVSAYFLAPGRLYEAVAGSARAVGAATIAAPLADAGEVVRLILARADAVGWAAVAEEGNEHRSVPLIGGTTDNRFAHQK